MNELEIIKKQRDILFECLKTISKSSNTPEAIKMLCNNAAKKAKNILNEEFPDSLDSSIPNIIEDTSPLKVGDKVKSLKNKICIYQIKEFGPIIENTQLVNLIIIKINHKDQSGLGSLSYNVPITLLQRV